MLFVGSACPSADASWRDPDCSELEPTSHEVRPGLEGVAEPTAQRRAAAYLDHAVCQRRLPESSFEPFFFTAADVGHRYRFGEYLGGFGKQPSALRVQTDSGLHLLFCFNQQVINCDEAQRCECPYDFNFSPPRRQAP